VNDEPLRLAESWFCERGDFWGTVNQLCVCAKCGKIEHKRHDEPRHYSGIFTPKLHMLCDECFDSLPAVSELRSRAYPLEGE
jgi:hypothetical protein